MEIRDFTGCFIVDGLETDRMDLRVLISNGGGVTSGSGSFKVPTAMIGSEAGGPLTFRCADGEVITLEVREFDLVQGVAYFLTSGAVPELRKRA